MFDLVDAYTTLATNPDSFWSREYLETDVAQQLMQNAQQFNAEDAPSVLMDHACPPPGTSVQISDVWLEIVCVYGNCVRQRTLDISGSQDREYCLTAMEQYLFMCRLHLARIENDLKEEVNSGYVRQLLVLVRSISDLLPSINELYEPLPQSRRNQLAMLYLEPLLHFLLVEELAKDSDVADCLTKFIVYSSIQQGLHTILEQQFLYMISTYEHISRLICDMLVRMYQSHGDRDVAERLLTDLSQKASQWTDSQNTAIVHQAKTIAALLRAISSVCPILLAYNLSALSDFMSCPVPQLRQAAVESSPQVITSIFDQGELEEAGPLGFKAAVEFLRLVEQRAADTNHFVRMRAVAAIASICDNKSLIKERLNFADIAVSKIADRTQLVRRQGMRLMKRLIETHPPIMHANNLSRIVWEKTLGEVEEIMPELEGEDLNSALQAVLLARENETETGEFQISTQPGNREEQLRAAHTFVVYTLQFIDRVDLSLSIVQTLLSSRSKFDNLDAIDLLVYADAYCVGASAKGIRSIMHLVWAKADNDDGNSVARAAVDCYRNLFLTAPPELGSREQAQIVTDNLIELVRTSTKSERTSLERLLELSMNNEYISRAVVLRLWGLYQSPQNEDKERRTYSALILSMLARADSSIARSGVGKISDVGLRLNSDVHDLELAQYSCAIVRYAVDPDKPSLRLPPSYALFDTIVAYLCRAAEPELSMQWVRTAKEALSAICSLCDSPPVVYTRLLCRYTELIFQGKATDNRQQLFAQAIFLAGEIALLNLVFLDRSEREFKKSMQETRPPSSDQPNSTADNKDPDDAILGSNNEDDFLDTLESLREECMLYSDKALLRPFADSVSAICTEIAGKCANELRESNALPINLTLFSCTQSLTKFMCVSSRYCAENLPLAIRIMGLHPSSIVRSNFLLAMSDATISFNHLIDEHTEVLYNRLSDPDNAVQRTCIIALTFLILAGQIKVKGRLGELAKATANTNSKISKLATMFFRELATKDNAIYNGFLDMLSFLIAADDLTDGDLTKILKFLCKFIDKERYITQLVTKVLQKLKRCDSNRQFTAYAVVLKNLAWKMDDDTKQLLAAGFLNADLSDSSDSFSGSSASSDEGDIAVKPATPTRAAQRKRSMRLTADNENNAENLSPQTDVPRLTDAVGDMSIT